MMMGKEAPLMTLLSGVVEPLSQKLELVLQSSYIRTVFSCLFLELSLPELQSTFVMGCSTKCALLRRSPPTAPGRLIDQCPLEPVVLPAPAGRAPTATHKATESHCAAVTLQPLEFLFSHGWDTQPSFERPEFLCSIVAPPQSRNEDCPRNRGRAPC